MSKAGRLNSAGRVRFAIAIPTEFAKPCPRGPGVVSTPRARPYSGGPGVFECRFRKPRSSSIGRAVPVNGTGGLSHHQAVPVRWQEFAGCTASMANARIALVKSWLMYSEDSGGWLRPYNYRRISLPWREKIPSEEQ